MLEKIIDVTAEHEGLGLRNALVPIRLFAL